MPKILYLIIIIISLTFPRLVSATSGLTISPATLEILIQPNKKLVQTLTVTNNGALTEYTVSLHQLVPIGNHGGSTIDLTQSLNLSSLPLYLTLNNQPIDNLRLPLEPGVNNLTLGIETPTTDQEKELYLILTFQPTLSSTQSISAAPTIGLPLLFTITMDAEFDYQLSLEDAKLPAIHDSGTPFTFSPKLQNHSAHMIRSGGTLQLTSPFNSTTYQVVPELILKDTVRALTFNKEEQTTSGITLAKSLKRIGPQTFVLTVKTIGDKTILTSTQTVWFLPINFIIIFLALLSFALAFAVRRKKPKNT